MYVDKIITAAVSPVFNGEFANPYIGEAETYGSWNYADERPTVYGDDTDLYDVTYIQVHGFTKGSTIALKKAIRNALRGVNFLIQNTLELYEDDTGYYHIIVEASIEGTQED